MANTIRDYSATAASNTVVDGADISEGCSPAGINDAIRGVLADLKDVSTGAVALESPAMDSLTVTGNVGAATFSGDGSALTGIPTPTLTSLGIANHDDITVDGSGNVGIGESSLTGNALEIRRSGKSGVVFKETGVAQFYVEQDTDAKIRITNSKNLIFSGGANGTTERLRIKSDGTLQLTSNAAGADTLEASITAYNAPQAQVNSRIDFLTDTYQNTGQIKLRTNYGATTRDGLIVDEKARVTMPYQPAWHLQPSWTSNTTPSSNSIIPFGVYGGHGTFATSVTVSSGRVTVPVSGKYWIAATMRQENSQTDYQIGLRKNGAQIIRSGIWYSSQAYENLHLMGMVNLAANDYLEIDISSSNMPPINGNTDTLTFFSGYLVG